MHLSIYGYHAKSSELFHREKTRKLIIYVINYTIQWHSDPRRSHNKTTPRCNKCVVIRVDTPNSCMLDTR